MGVEGISSRAPAADAKPVKKVKEQDDAPKKAEKKDDAQQAKPSEEVSEVVHNTTEDSREGVVA